MAWTLLLLTASLHAADCSPKLQRFLADLRAKKFSTPQVEDAPVVAAAPARAPSRSTAAVASAQPGVTERTLQQLWQEAVLPANARLSSPIDQKSLALFTQHRLEPVAVPVSLPGPALGAQQAPAIFTWTIEGQEKFGIGSARAAIPFREVTQPEARERLRNVVGAWRKSQRPEYQITQSMATLEREAKAAEEAFREETAKFSSLRRMMGNKPEFVARMDAERGRGIEKHYTMLQRNLHSLSMEHRAQALNFKWLQREAIQAGDADLAAKYASASAAHLKKARQAADDATAANQILASRKAGVTPPDFALPDVDAGDGFGHEAIDAERMERRSRK